MEDGGPRGPVTSDLLRTEMTILARLPRPEPGLRLFTDDAILAAFLSETALAGSGRRVERFPPRASAALPLPGPAGPLVLDRPAFDVLEPVLPGLAQRAPVILVADGADLPLLRRFRAAGGTALIPPSFERPRFLAAFALALTGEVYLPPALWLADLDARLAPAPGADGLTPRQRDVLAELAAGKSNKQIARSLGLAEPTVKMHLAHIGRKLGVTSRTQLLARALRPPRAEPAATA